MSMAIARSFEGLPRRERGAGILAALRSAVAAARGAEDAAVTPPTTARPIWAYRVRATEDALAGEEREIVLSLAAGAARAKPQAA